MAKPLLQTTIAGSLPKPAWLAQPNELWAPWLQPAQRQGRDGGGDLRCHGEGRNPGTTSCARLMMRRSARWAIY